MKASPTPLAIMLAAWLVFLVLVVRAIWRSDDPPKAKIYTGAKFGDFLFRRSLGSVSRISCRFPGFQASRLPGFQASRLGIGFDMGSVLVTLYSLRRICR